MKISKIFLFFLLAGSTFLNAQNADRKFVSVIQKNATVEIKTNDGVYQIKPYSEKIVETTFIPNGEAYNPNSHAVVLNPENLQFKISEK